MLLYRSPISDVQPVGQYTYVNGASLHPHDYLPQLNKGTSLVKMATQCLFLHQLKVHQECSTVLDRNSG